MLKLDLGTPRYGKTRPHSTASLHRIHVLLKAMAAERHIGARNRFYIMRLPKRGMTFDRITYHANVTQCLGGLTPADWYLAVAAPTSSVQKSPVQQDLHAFRIPAGKFVKLHQGTWHAGPLFQDSECMDFYNLELSDTNQVDHNTHVYSKQDGLQFEVQT